MQMTEDLIRSVIHEVLSQMGSGGAAANGNGLTIMGPFATPHRPGGTVRDPSQKKPDEAPPRGCSRQVGCPMFGLFKLASNLQLWRERYCVQNPERCVRLQRSNQGEDVPPNMLPNGTLLKGGGS